MCLVVYAGWPSLSAVLIHELPGVFWMCVWHSQTPGGPGLCCRVWKQIFNQSNQSLDIDGLMDAVMDLMRTQPFSHSIVIDIARPHHLIAISHHHTLLGAICKNCLLIYLSDNISQLSEMVRPNSSLAPPQMCFRWEKAGRQAGGDELTGL